MLGRLRSLFSGGLTRWVPLSAVDSLFGRTPKAGSVTEPDQALTLSPYWCGVRLYQTTLGSLPLRTYRPTAGSTWEPETGTPVARLLEVAPNPAMTRAVFWQLLAKDLIHEHGEAFALVQRDGASQVTALYPISPRHVVQVAVDGRWRKAYHVIDPLLGDQVYFDEEIVHLIGYSHDGFRGVRLLRYAAEALGLHKQIQDAAGASYQNAVRPSGYLSFPAEIKKDAVEQIKTFFADAYAGVKNAGKVPVLTAGGKFERFDDHSADDAKILDALGSSVDDVARWLGVSPLLLFNLARGTYSNLGAERSGFYTRSVRPLVDGFELELNRKLFPAGDRWCEFDADAILRGDPQQQAEEDASGIQAGWRTRAEVRERRGLPPLPGLDKPLMPVNMAAVGEDGRPEPTPAANAPQPAGVPAL